MPRNLTMTSAGYSAGKFGQALSAGHADGPGGVQALPAGSWTLECWVKGPNPGAAQAIAGDSSQFLIIDANGNIGVSYGQGSSRTAVNSSTCIMDDTWHHLAAVAGPAGCRLFVDGAVVASNTATSLTAAGDSPSSDGFFVRYFASYPGYYDFTGLIDEVAIFSTQRYTASFTVPAAAYVGNETGLAYLYHFDGDGSDSQGNTSSAATAYTLTGPSSGVSGSASAAFTVQANGTLSAAVTFTPSDGNAGGSFSPASVTLASGSASSATFTYTPSSAGTKTISTTNSGSLTNPAAVSYAASSAGATAYTLSGPSSGTAGSASSTFTVTLNSTLGTAATITPSDGSGGGTFSPTAVTIASGTTTGTFTYTPAGAGTKTISTTNNRSLSDPAALSYAASAPPVVVARNSAAIFQAPYAWHDDGTSINAGSPGAYIKTVFTGTSLGMTIVPLATGLQGYPRVRGYIDDLPPVEVATAGSQANYSIATGLAAGSHTLRLITSWIDTSGAWDLSTAFKLVSLRLDRGASASAPTLRSKRALWFGDSITCGVATDVRYPSVFPQGMDAELSPVRLLCEMLDVEVGQIGFGGQGFNVAAGSAAGNVPALNTAYAYYSSGVSRLVSGLFSPAPDYVLCWHGTNPVNGSTAQSDVATAISNLRAAAPNAIVFMMVPIGGFRRAEIKAATNAVIAAGDTKVVLIDAGSDYSGGLTQYGAATAEASDGLHPYALSGARWASKAASLIQHALEPRRFDVLAA